MTDKRLVDTILSVFALIFYGALFTSLLYAAGKLGYLTPNWLLALMHR